MARYLGPKCRIMRSLGMDLSLKSIFGTPF